MTKPRSYRSAHRSAQSDEARRRILLAAGRAFAAKGFRGGSLRDIAAAAKLGPGAVLYHFRSKKNLFKQTISHFTVELARLNRHFAPLMELDGAPPQAVADALHRAIASFLSACHGPQAVPGLLDLYLRILSEGDKSVLRMLLDCFAPLQAGLVQWLKRLRPDLDEVFVAFWQQLLWSQLQYTVVSKRLVLYDMDLKKDYTPEYLKAAAWCIARACCLAIDLPQPAR